MEFIAHNVANVIPRVGECRLKYDHFANVSKTLSQCRGMWIEMVVQKASLVWRAVNKSEKKYQNNY